MDRERRIAAVRMDLLRDDHAATELYYNSALFRISLDQLASVIIDMVQRMAEAATEQQIRNKQLIEMMKRGHVTADELTAQMRDAGLLSPDVSIRFGDDPEPDIEGGMDHYGSL